MVDLTEKMLEVVRETIEYYDSPEKFGFDVGGCTYYNLETGAMCSVGRYMDNPKKAVECLVAGSFKRVSEDYPELTRLKRGYEHIPTEFWNRLQLLHDTAAGDYDSISECIKKSEQGMVYYTQLMEFIEL